jgi:hypothetical protein
LVKLVYLKDLVMKFQFLAALVGSIALSASSAFAGTKVSYGSCPAYIGNLKTKTYMSTAGLNCSSSPMKAGGLKLNQVITQGVYKFVTDFDVSGQGQANTDAFQVGKNPPTVNYSYNDTNNRGSFTIEVIDITTHKVVETLVSIHGGLSGTT